MMNRRGFLRRAGAAVIAAVAAPLYIPSERLDFGVPTQGLDAPRSLYLPPETWNPRTTTVTWKNVLSDAEEIATIIPIAEQGGDGRGYEWMTGTYERSESGVMTSIAFDSDILNAAFRDGMGLKV